jgi:hypothetical protein
MTIGPPLHFVPFPSHVVVSLFLYNCDNVLPFDAS